MKKLLILALALCFIVAGFSVASAKQMNTGCGLGTIVFPNADSLLMELLVTTTNGTSGNATFGMTTGTSNCTFTKYVENESIEKFVAANMDSLANEMAAGQGESLSTLAELMGVADKAEFASVLQANFSKVFTSADVQSGQVLDNIVRVIS